MKPIQVESTNDSTVSVQVIRMEIIDHTGTRKGLDEICLLIEDENGDHVATFTPGQAAKLIRVIESTRRQIAAKSTK